MSDILQRLEQVLIARKDAAPESSYTARLYAGGTGAICGKIAEEAVEVLNAADAPAAELTHEVADLWFHTLVLLAARGVAVTDILAELEHRFGVSGLDEKASRDG